MLLEESITALIRHLAVAEITPFRSSGGNWQMRV